MVPRTRSLLAVVVGLVLASGVAAPAHADDQSWTSLYAGTEYDGAGWAACPGQPVTVSVDRSALDPDQRSKAKAAVKLALQKWNRLKNFQFAFGGEIPVQYDKATGVSTPADGVARDRWIYITFVKAKDEQKAKEKGVVGLAGPLRVDPATKTIVEASAAFLAQYVNRQSKALVAELFAHELGHVAGLGHSTSKKDVMYPILSGHKELGPGDIAGAAALLHPCPAPPPAQPAG